MSAPTFFMLAFGAICIQMLVGLIQVREIRNALRNTTGRGVVGIGHNKTIIRPGRIIILNYDPENDRVIDTRIMKGYTNFAKFKSCPDYTGMSLDQVRERALEEDAEFFKHRRKKHPYSPEEIHKKKGALIQAVEQIEIRKRETIDETKRPIRVVRHKEPKLLKHKL